LRLKLITIACTIAQAESIVSLQPFESENDLRSKLQKKKGVSPRYFDEYVRMLEGYDSVDTVIEKCEKVGKEISDVLAVWAAAADPSSDAIASNPDISDASDTGIHLVAVGAKSVVEDPLRAEALEAYITSQPSMMTEGVVLKDYQLLGINWLALLHRKKLSCILADEMGWCYSQELLVSFAQHVSCVRSWQNHPSHRILCASEGAERKRPLPGDCAQFDVR
jgi:SWI/SNF-related matrix-associated actin-dependent regulator 1 of chromatin subfamily A